MARRRRRGGHPLDLAGGLTALWAASFVLLVVFPRLFGGTPAPLSAGNVVLLVVLAVLAGAAWAWAIRTLRAQLARGKRLEELQALTPEGFERWVGARFREAGYAVRVTGTHGTHGTGGDHGIDLVVSKPGELAVVQAKKFVTKAVGEPVLRDLYGAMTAAGADRAYLVTTGRITDEARRWARGKPIELWDAETVARLSLEEEGPARRAWLAAESDKGVIAAELTTPRPAAATTTTRSGTCPAVAPRWWRGRTSGAGSRSWVARASRRAVTPRLPSNRRPPTRSRAWAHEHGRQWTLGPRATPGRGGVSRRDPPAGGVTRWPLVQLSSRCPPG
jgi:restriction system protein